MIESELFEHIKQTRNIEDNLLTLVKDAVQAEYDSGHWENVLEWRDLLFDLLDTASAWEKALEINTLAMQAAIFMNRDVLVARYTHDEADILSRKGHYPETIPLYEKSFQIFEQLREHKQATFSLHMLSLAKRAVGDSREAEILSRECLRRAEVYQLGYWRAHPLHLLAWVARDKRDFKTALDYLFEAAAIHEASQDDDRTIMLAQTYYDIAQIYVWAGNTESAEKYMAIANQWDERAGRFEGSYKSEKLLGDILMLKGESREAISQYQQALDTVQRGPDERRVADLYLDLAQAYFRVGDLGRAFGYLRNGIAQARILGLFTAYKARLGLLLQWRTLFYSRKHKEN